MSMASSRIDIIIILYLLSCGRNEEPYPISFSEDIKPKQLNFIQRRQNWVELMAMIIVSVMHYASIFLCKICRARTVWWLVD